MMPMSDPTTPVDVIAREIDPWLEWGGERQAATDIITALSEAGYEIVRAAPEPSLRSIVAPGRDRWPATDEQVDAEWETFWKPLVAPNGEVDPALVKLELYDFSQLIANATEVYAHVTGGKIAKVTTLPEAVTAVADDHYAETCDYYARDSEDTPEPDAPERVEEQ